MGRTRTQKITRIGLTCAVISVFTVGLTLPMRAQDVPLKRQLRGRHRLLRRVFVNADDRDIKGLAATIKADEITQRHRIRAVRYLATVDSGSYPEAKQMLINTLHTDKWEEVRFEAAKALRLMLAGNSSGAERTPRLFRMWLRRWRRHTRRSFRTSVRGRRDFNRTACDPETLNALVRTAYELHPDGYCFESSGRVREMAVTAIRDSGVLCDVGPYIAGSEQQQNLQPPAVPFEPGQPGVYETLPIEPSVGHMLKTDSASFEVAASPVPMPPAPGTIPKTQAKDWSPLDTVPNLPVIAPREPQVSRTTKPPTVVSNVPAAQPPTTTPRDFEPQIEPPNVRPTASDAVPAPCLNGFCVVELSHRRKLPVIKKFSTVYDDRLYYFSSAEALAEFVWNPEQYAVAYGGFDPVAYASRQETVEGKLLRVYDGTFYSFASDENWQEFQAQPDLYAILPEDLLTDEEYLAQSVAEFKQMDAEAAAAANQTAKPAASQPPAAPSPGTLALSAIDLVPPPPANSDVVADTNTPKASDFENPFEGTASLDDSLDDSDFSAFGEPDEALPELAKILGAVPLINLNDNGQHATGSRDTVPELTADATFDDMPANDDTWVDPWADEAQPIPVPSAVPLVDLNDPRQIIAEEHTPQVADLAADTTFDEPQRPADDWVDPWADEVQPAPVPSAVPLVDLNDPRQTLADKRDHRAAELAVDATFDEPPAAEDTWVDPWTDDMELEPTPGRSDSLVQRWAELGLREPTKQSGDTEDAWPILTEREPLQIESWAKDPVPFQRKQVQSQPRRAEPRRLPPQPRQATPEPRRLQEPVASSKHGWSSLITTGSRQPNQRTNLRRPSPFTKALTTQDTGFQVTSITDRAMTTKSPVRHIAHIRLGDVRRQEERRRELRRREEAPASTRQPTPVLRPASTGSSATLRPVDKNRTRSLVAPPASRSRTNNQLIKPLAPRNGAKSQLIVPRISRSNSVLTRPRSSNSSSLEVTTITGRKSPRGNASESNR